MTDEDNACDPQPFSTGDVIDDKWVLIERIGEGGMGVVYRAHQLNLKRDVAIKVISEKMLVDLADNAKERATAIERFRREVQTMAQVRQLNVLQIYDYGSEKRVKKGTSRQVEYIVMEYVPGNTLRYTLSEYGFGDEIDLTADWLRRYFLPVLDGMAAIHAHGIIHRDMKPENILMDGHIPKIADFGLARSLRLRCVSDSWEVKGTWPYMAPEQFSDFRKAAEPADIYALGKILYEAVEGKLDQSTPPFKQVSLKDPSAPMLRALDGVIRKATDEDPNRRYPSIAELRLDLLALLERPAPSALSESKHVSSPPLVRWLWIGIAAAVLSVAGMTAYHLWEGVEKRPSPETAFRPESQTPPEAEPRKTELTRARLAADGREMRLLTDPASGRRFYADTSLVTFHHYLDFLNEVTDTVSVTDGVVRQGSDILFYLEKHVVFQNDRFRLLDTALAPQPVTRVSWLGARAYARNFDKRIPTHADWLILRQEIPESVEPIRSAAAGPVDDTAPPMHMMHRQPSADPEKPNQADAAVSMEWVGVEVNGRLSSRVVAWPAGGKSAELIRRYPWEGFVDVGFRTVMDGDKNPSE
jgi:serine/threonine-protein kinase